MIGYLTTNNAYDSFVIVENEEVITCHTIDGEQSFRDALLVGNEQDLSNWSSDTNDVSKPSDVGDVIAINDGEKLTILNERLFEQRRAFWLGE